MAEIKELKQKQEQKPSIEKEVKKQTELVCKLITTGKVSIVEVYGIPEPLIFNGQVIANDKLKTLIKDKLEEYYEKIKASKEILEELQNIKITIIILPGYAV